MAMFVAAVRTSAVAPAAASAVRVVASPDGLVTAAVPTVVLELSRARWSLAAERASRMVVQVILALVI